jgi:hypothetical protein
MYFTTFVDAKDEAALRYVAGACKLALESDLSVAHRLTAK